MCHYIFEKTKPCLIANEETFLFMHLLNSVIRAFHFEQKYYLTLFILRVLVYSDMHYGNDLFKGW